MLSFTRVLMNTPFQMEIDGDGLSGSFPRHRLALLYEWRDAHRDELLANWERLRRGQSPVAIAPLD